MMNKFKIVEIIGKNKEIAFWGDDKIDFIFVIQGKLFIEFEPLFNH